MNGSSENPIKEITKNQEITKNHFSTYSQLKSEQNINRNTRRLQTNQKDFKQNSSSHMKFIYIEMKTENIHTLKLT